MPQPLTPGVGVTFQDQVWSITITGISGVALVFLYVITTIPRRWWRTWSLGRSDPGWATVRSASIMPERVSMSHPTQSITCRRTPA